MSKYGKIHPWPADTAPAKSKSPAEYVTNVRHKRDASTNIGTTTPKCAGGKGSDEQNPASNIFHPLLLFVVRDEADTVFLFRTVENEKVLVSVSEEKKELKPLSKKHQRVLDEYLVCFNKWKSYQKVYPSTTYESAKSASSRLFADVNFSAHLSDRLSEAHMTADEALKLQADIARGDITELLTPLGHVDIDLIRKNGKGRLIKKIKQRTITKIGKSDKDEDTEIHETEIELYPADTAQERILRMTGNMKDTNVTINVNLTDD